MKASDLERALVNADAAGDAEAARVIAREIVKLRNQQPQQEKPPADSALKRFAFGAQEPITGAAQMLYNALPESVRSAGDKLDDFLYQKTGGILGSKPGDFNQNVAQMQAGYNAPEGFDAARLAGNMATGLLATRGMGMPATVGKATAQGAGVGAAFGASNPVYQGNFWDEKGQQVSMGGAIGAATGPLSAGIARVVSPKASVNPEIARLREAGVKDMTVGQVLGGRAAAAEEKLTALPVVGDMIAKARMTARDQFNVAAINDALKPLGKSVGKSGHEAIDEAASLVSQAYDDAANLIAGVKLDSIAKGEINGLRNLVRNIPDGMGKRFNKFFQENVAKRMSPAGGIDSKTFKIIDTDINKMIARYKGGSGADKELADAFLELRRVLQEQARRSSPDYSQALKKADAAYARLVRVEGAAAKAANSDGVFTPGQLMQSLRTADKSARKNQTARGKALMQDLAKAGQNVLGDKIPNSGTPERMFMSGGALGGSYLVDPMLTAGLVGGAGLYTQPMQRLLTQAVSQRPGAAQAVANQVRKAGPRAAIPAVGLFGAGN